MQWSAEDLASVLTNSPWVSLCIARNNATSIAQGRIVADPDENQPASTLTPNWVNVHPLMTPPDDRHQPPILTQGTAISYRIRLLTSKPMREAYLGVIDRGPGFARQIGLDPPFERQVSLENLMKGGRLEEFMVNNPDDIRLKGSERYIVLTITEARRHWFQSERKVWATDLWEERAKTELFMNLQLSDLAPVTFLSTRTGKKTPIVRYEPPGVDHLGAKFHFARQLPDGSPFVTPDDKELRFESKIDGKKIEAKFDLKKLICKGKLEY